MTMPVTAAALTAAFLCAHTQAPPTFRAGTHAIVVPVAVFDGDQVVLNLTAQDFQIRDNGVQQTVTSADLNTLPIDLRLMFDTSGSISEEDFAYFLRTMRQVTGALQPMDRCEIMTFSLRVAEAAARQSPPVKIDLKRGPPEGTAFFDAVTLALATAPTPDRRQITIVLSDARDNASFFDEATMLEAARLTDAVVYTILPGDPRFSTAVSAARLHALSLLTGGRLVRAPERTLGTVINDAITEFRQSYAVRYTLTGASIEGWHKLDVRVRGRNSYRIRTRAGYFGR
jgi:VWFA-related protein